MTRNFRLYQTRQLLLTAQAEITEHSDWLYLGYSYRTFLDLENILGKSKEMETLYKRIAEKAERLRKEYVKTISKASEKNERLSWHLSTVAESNTMTSNLFLDTCYFSICLDILNENGGPILIVVDSDALFDSLTKTLKSSKHRGCHTFAEKKPGWFSLISLGRVLINSVYSALGFLKRIIYRKGVFWFGTGKGMEKIGSKNIILVHTFANDSCFGQGGIFKERYFGALIQKMKDSGFSVVYLLHTGYASRKFSEIVNWCKKSDSSFLFVEQLVSLKDILLSLLAPFGLLKARISGISVGGVNLPYLIKKQLLKECLDGGLRNHYLYYAAIKNLAKHHGAKIRYLLDIYEGHVLERAMRMSAKRFMSDCKIIAFSHSSFSRNHLSFFTSIPGTNYNVAPDYLLCTGNAYKDIFITNGFEKEMVYAVGNLRQEVPERFNSNPEFSLEKNRILVALPLLVNDAQELLWKTNQAFSGSDLRVFIYKHPMMPMKSLEVMIEGRLAENISFAMQPTAKGLRECDLVITTGSNMSADALKAGLPVISVVRTIGLTFEPLHWFKSTVSYCVSPKQIREEAVRLLSLPEDKRLINSMRGKSLVEDCLGRIDNEIMDSFMLNASVAQVGP